MANILSAATHILTVLILLLSLPILVLTSLLATWTSKSLSDFPMVKVASTTSIASGQIYSILAFPHTYNSYGLILNIIPGAGGTIDALLLLICLGSIDVIYLGRRTHLAKAAKACAARGEAPTWLWGITIFIVAFSVCRSLVGLVGSMVGYYTSASFLLPVRGDIKTDSNDAYIAPDGKGFSVGGWVCQVKDHVIDGDAYGSKLRSLCGQEQAARWLTLPLFLCYSLLLVVVVMRFMGEKRRVQRASVEAKTVGSASESE